MLRKKVLVFPIILLIVAQYGCKTSNQNNHKYKAYQDMKDFVLDDYNRHGSYLLFFETHTKNEIIYERAIDTQYPLCNSSKFKGIDMDPYFKDIMLGKIILPCGDIGECFTLSSKITKEYQEKGVDEI